MFRYLIACFLLAGSVLAKPNIIYINADDLGVMDVNYNSDRYLTPNINRLCAEGMVFSEAYAAAANCAPSRACAMSGQYAPRHGVYTVGNSDRGAAKHRKLIPIMNTEKLALDNLTIAGALQQAGYKTIHLGKWHLGDDPTQQGFDINIGGDMSGGPSGGGYFSPFSRGPMTAYNDKYPEGTHRVDIFADQAVKFMQVYREQPFFMYMSFYSVHTKLEPVPGLVEKYDPSRVRPDYASMIEKMDQGIGRILNALEQLNLKRNTLVVFTSDNGGIKKTSSQAPFRSGKGSYFDGGIRVPLVIRWPGHVSQALCEVPVSGIDFYPTFLEAAELPVPEGKVLDGVSLTPLFKKRGTIPERPLFWHFPVYLQKYAGKGDDSHDEYFRTRPGSVIRLGRWKLHEYFEDGRIELYDLAADPAERMNFAHIHPEKASAMHQMLKDWRKETNAPVPTELNPKYKAETASSSK
ncbi:sulfatase [Pontiellaceae bacterium B12227]|nr:sulfatase [Pontiellaceae bacterium B12227]